MKIASFYRNDAIVYGVVTQDGIVTPDDEFLRRFPTVTDLFAQNAVTLLAQNVAVRDPDQSLEETDFTLPIHPAGRIVCVGVNYPKRYPLDAPAPPPNNIILFAKLDGMLVPHGKPLEIPPGAAAETFDYEGEIVLVIGKEGRHIPADRAFDYIAGYTIMNEGSVRGWQKHSIHAGKNFEKSGSCGPWIVTADEITKPNEMVLTTRLNGNRVQHTTAGEMVFKIPELIAYISNTMTLRPGDMIATGSPEGSGGSLQPPRFLRQGDALEIEVSGIGILANNVG
ncbi:MAG: fumarylacetoacetate hydrolase family protein [Alphaproteobacteria bacterium]|nr:fumarylacetoacetate hydrolase family protein [Alphaproteobacteria bacterium]